MGIRKNHVSKLIKAAKAHDALVAAKGGQADEETDKARASYEKLRRSSTPEERTIFDRIYM